MKKKPTKKDIEVVISNLINHLRVVEEKVVALDNIFGLYIKYKKDDADFQKFVGKQLEEVQGNGENK